MSALLPCTSCARHVRRAEPACPFCGAALALVSAPPPRIVSARISRGVLFGLGPALLLGAASMLDACANATYGAPDANFARDDAAHVDGGTDAAQTSADAALADTGDTGP